MGTVLRTQIQISRPTIRHRGGIIKVRQQNEAFWREALHRDLGHSTHIICRRRGVAASKLLIRNMMNTSASSFTSHFVCFVFDVCSYVSSMRLEDERHKKAT